MLLLKQLLDTTLSRLQLVKFKVKDHPSVLAESLRSGFLGPGRRARPHALPQPDLRQKRLLKATSTIQYQTDMLLGLANSAPETRVLSHS